MRRCKFFHYPSNETGSLDDHRWMLVARFSRYQSVRRNRDGMRVPWSLFFSPSHFTLPPPPFTFPHSIQYARSNLASYPYNYSVIFVGLLQFTSLYLPPILPSLLPRFFLTIAFASSPLTFSLFSPFLAFIVIPLIGTTIYLLISRIGHFFKGYQLTPTLKISFLITGSPPPPSLSIPLMVEYILLCYMLDALVEGFILPFVCFSSTVLFFPSFPPFVHFCGYHRTQR